MCGMGHEGGSVVCVCVAWGMRVGQGVCVCGMGHEGGSGVCVAWGMRVGQG